MVRVLYQERDQEGLWCCPEVVDILKAINSSLKQADALGEEWMTGLQLEELHV